MKLLISTQTDLSHVNLNGDTGVVLAIILSEASAASTLSVFGQEQFDLIESNHALNSQIFSLSNKLLWKSLFSALKQNGEINLNVGVSDHSQLPQVSSILKLNGFSNIHVSESLIQAKKPVWQAAGAPLKRREKQADQIQSTNLTTLPKQEVLQQQPANSNPWAALSNQPARVQLINEDELMKDESSNAQVFQKFCGEGDKIQAGKPCENCTCGRKEQEEGKAQQQIKDLEKGNIQSDCGKCYLGDAFRCASCPYAGLPAFEPGDKVKLKNSTNAQVAADASEKIQVKASVGTKVVLDL